MTTILAILQMYPFCKYGSETPEMMLLIGEEIYCSNWYKCSIKQQKYIQLIISFSQMSRKISGYGIIDCNYETLMKVC